jgi:hypothetical protein
MSATISKTRPATGTELAQIMGVLLYVLVALPFAWAFVLNFVAFHAFGVTGHAGWGCGFAITLMTGMKSGNNRS